MRMMKFEQSMKEAKATTGLLKAIGFKLERAGCNLKLPVLVAVASWDNFIFSVPCNSTSRRELTIIYNDCQFYKSIGKTYSIDRIMADIRKIPNYEDLADYVKGYNSRCEALTDYAII